MKLDNKLIQKWFYSQPDVKSGPHPRLASRSDTTTILQLPPVVHWSMRIEVVAKVWEQTSNEHHHPAVVTSMGW